MAQRLATQLADVDGITVVNKVVLNHRPIGTRSSTSWSPNAATERLHGRSSSARSHRDRRRLRSLPTGHRSTPVGSTSSSQPRGMSWSSTRTTAWKLMTAELPACSVEPGNEQGDEYDRAQRPAPRIDTTHNFVCGPDHQGDGADATDNRVGDATQKPADGGCYESSEQRNVRALSDHGPAGLAVAEYPVHDRSSPCLYRQSHCLLRHSRAAPQPDAIRRRVPSRRS